MWTGSACAQVCPLTPQPVPTPPFPLWVTFCDVPALAAILCLALPVPVPVGARPWVAAAGCLCLPPGVPVWVCATSLTFILLFRFTQFMPTHPFYLPTAVTCRIGLPADTLPLSHPPPHPSVVSQFPDWFLCVPPRLFGIAMDWVHPVPCLPACCARAPTPTCPTPPPA